MHRHTEICLVAEAGNGREAVEQFRAHRPDITLMDLQMPVMGGSDAIAAIRKDFPDARIIVLTTYSGDAQAERAFKAGAYGYLLKSMLRKELVETIHTVHGGRKRMPREIAVELVEHRAEDALSEREIEVLRQLGTGNSNKMIADHLNLSEETVKAHMRSILSKLGANDRTHALAIALKRGIIELVYSPTRATARSGSLLTRGCRTPALRGFCQLLQPFKCREQRYVFLPAPAPSAAGDSSMSDA